MDYIYIAQVVQRDDVAEITVNNGVLHVGVGWLPCGVFTSEVTVDLSKYRYVYCGSDTHLYVSNTELTPGTVINDEATIVLPLVWPVNETERAVVQFVRGEKV